MDARQDRRHFGNGHHPIRTLMLGGALLVTVTLGIVIPPAALADGCALREESVQFVGVSQNQRSTELIEVKKAVNFPTTAIERSDPVTASADTPQASRTAL